MKVMCKKKNPYVVFSHVVLTQFHRLTVMNAFALFACVTRACDRDSIRVCVCALVRVRVQ